MPGITGIIANLPVEDRSAALGRMLKRLMHEPWYKSGSLAHEKLNLSAAWVCQPDSFSDCLPIWNTARDRCLIFSGEHFADSSAATAAHLIPIYEAQGMKFFGQLNGIFSGLVVDLRENKIVLFNDRYGLGRVYFHESADGFYFASEAKTLLEVLPQLRKLDLRSLGEFFACGCALQNRTLFDGISLLPPGSAWTFRPGLPIKKETYFDQRAWETLPPLSPDEYYAQLKETFGRLLPAYFGGKRKVGLSLTGGLDSRMIIAAAARAPGALPCYTFGGMYRDCADVKISRRIANVCGQSHRVLPVDRSFFSQFPDLAARSVYYTDGAMDVTGAVELFANRLAREMAPVRLTGNYGGEILRGYVAFRPNPTVEAMLDRQFVPIFRNAAESYNSERKNLATTPFVAFKQVPWHHFGRFALEQTQLSVRSPFLDNQLVPLACQAPPDAEANRQFAPRLIADANPALARIPTDRGTVGQWQFLPRKLRNFCQEFLPRAEYVYDYGMPQWLAKTDRALTPFHFERLFLGRQKFYHFRTWYRHELSAHVKEMLLDPRSLGRPYLDGKRVEQIVNAHTQGTGNHTLEIHKLLTIELLQRQLIENSSNSPKLP
jgi:asparagine synthase (glutamine-hydrolysing)